MDKIELIIENKNEFNSKHIFECGQFFRYKQISENHYIAFSKNKKVEVFERNSYYIIKCNKNDKEYFTNFFDLNTNYDNIKCELKNNIPLLDKAIEFGYGIRILKQDIFETIISFIISANNNIKRIQKSIEFLCENAGESMGDYFAFPTLEQLENKTEDFFTQAGLGYRAKYMVNALKQLKDINLNETQKISTSDLRQILENLAGVGPKVADCILLFGYGRKDVFPVDTWIKKVYVQDFNGNENNTKKIANALVKKFGDLSGYAQQYLFYYKRTLKK